MIKPVDDLAKECFDWAESVFPNRTDSSMGLKLYSEIGEMLESGGDPLEVADVLIMILDYAVCHGVVIQDAVERKLEINRTRNWVQLPNGTMHHAE